MIVTSLDHRMACGRQLYSVPGPAGGRDNCLADICQPSCANTSVGLDNYLAVPAPGGGRHKVTMVQLIIVNLVVQTQPLGLLVKGLL